MKERFSGSLDFKLVGNHISTPRDVSEKSESVISFGLADFITDPRNHEASGTLRIIFSKANRKWSFETGIKLDHSEAKWPHLARFIWKSNG